MATDLTIGTVLLGKYRIEGILGRGGFGSVYRATDLLLNRTVAIKILSQSQTTLEERLGEGSFDSYLARFRREATISAYFTQNRNIITVYGLEQDDENYYLVLEYLEGGSLADLLKSQPVLSVPQACAIALDICNALAEIHQHPADIVHRDLKPGNILLRKNGQAVVADFGIAQLGQESQRTNALPMRHPGSPAYMSPEQAGGYAYLTPASDLYALGLIMYLMLTGRPYPKTRTLPPSRLNGQIPTWLDNLVSRLLQDDPRQRFNQAEEVGEIIQANSGPSLPTRRQSQSLPANQPTLLVSPEAPTNQQERTTPLPYLGGNYPSPPPAPPARPTVSPGLLYSGLAGILLLIVLVVGGILLIANNGKSNPSPVAAATNTVAPTTATPASTTAGSTSSGGVNSVPSTNNPTTPPAATTSASLQGTTGATGGQQTTAAPTQTSAPTFTPIPTATSAPSFSADTNAIQQALQGLPGSSAGAVILPDGRTIGNRSDAQLPSASVIKLWIAATFFEEVKAGRISLNENYTIKPDDNAPGTGILRNNVGKTYTYDQLIETTLVYSDNAGANILINRIGGFDKINSYIQRNGYKQTKIQRFLGDVNNPNNNFTSAQDCALYFQRLLKDQIIDAPTSNRLRTILLKREADPYDKPYNFFARKLPSTVSYLHISGTGTGTRNEVGSFNLSSGEAVVVAMLISQANETDAENALAASVLQITQAVK